MVGSDRWMYWCVSKKVTKGGFLIFKILERHTAAGWRTRAGRSHSTLQIRTQDPSINSGEPCYQQIKSPCPCLFHASASFCSSAVAASAHAANCAQLRRLKA